MKLLSYNEQLERDYKLAIKWWFDQKRLEISLRPMERCKYTGVFMAHKK